MKDEEYAMAFLKEFGLKNINDRLLYNPKSLPINLIISKQLFIDKKTRKYKANKFNRGQYMKVLAQVIQNPYEIWRVPVNISGKSSDNLRFIRVFDLDDVPFGGFSVFNLYHSGRYWSGSTVFAPNKIDYLERQRQGTLLYREDGQGFLQ